MARKRREISDPKCEDPPAPVVVASAASAKRPLTLGLDMLLIAGFLALTFLLGIFPLKDTDFWWHLRTGDLIRQGAGFPQTDWYTFGAEGSPWIDLHWLFEVLISYGYSAGGVPLLTLAKCVITTLAVYLLVTSRRAGWPIWVMVLAWLPALLLLSGRMYVRPETLTLLYLAVFLAVLFRWLEHPWLAFVLPFVQVLWVNTQGLFILGPAVLGCALIDAALQRNPMAAANRQWWRTISLASALTFAACLVNPYGLRGSLFPLELAGTMSSPIFSRSIAELMPVLPMPGGDSFSFVGQMGFRNLPLQLHLGCLVLGALSFVVPILWTGFDRLRRGGPLLETTEPPAATPRQKRKKAARATEAVKPRWRLSVFRLLIFSAFSLLSLKATRNSHQFAAVAGTVTAWNLAEWVAVMCGRSPGAGIKGRLLALVAVACVIVAVGTGRFYAWAGEGRTIGLDEEPLWYPHAAVKKAGEPGMPDRFVCFHNGHAALYEYAHGPDRKTYADARLEVVGPRLYSEYLELQRVVGEARPGWQEALGALGSPGVLVDNVFPSFAGISATLMADRNWRCVWFDAIAAVFVPATSAGASPPFDFEREHFRGGAQSVATEQDAKARLAAAKAAFEVAYQLLQRGQASAARPLLLFGVGRASQAMTFGTAGAEAIKILGLLESVREPVGTPEQPVPRFKLPWDPVFDLSATRAVSLLRRYLVSEPEDLKVLLTLSALLESRGMDDQALPLLDRLQQLDPPDRTRSVTRMARELAAAQAQRLRARMGSEPATAWNNQDELSRVLDRLQTTGRARASAEVLEAAYPGRARDWPVADRLATLWLNLGETERARTTWQEAPETPRPALASARVAATYYAENRLEEARRFYEMALQEEPELFEALYGLACVERDDGRAPEARAAAEAAARAAASQSALEAAQAITSQVAPYAAGD